MYEIKLAVTESVFEVLCRELFEIVIADGRDGGGGGPSEPEFPQACVESVEPGGDFLRIDGGEVFAFFEAGLDERFSVAYLRDDVSAGRSLYCG